MKKYKIFAGVVVLECLVLILFYALSLHSVHGRQSEMESKRELVKKLYLTDLAIWTEARYTRHPSQADRFAPFQDVPASIEHFPAGSIVAPPENMAGIAENKSN